MEEKKTKMGIKDSEEKLPKQKPDNSGKISYEELNSRYMELNVQYQKLMQAYRKAIDDLQNNDLTTFCLQSMFKVLEHPNRYSDKFVNWCVAHIQGALTSLVEATLLKPEASQPAPEETPNEKADEA